MCCMGWASQWLRGWDAVRALVVAGGGTGLGEEGEDCAMAEAWAFCMLRSCRRADSGWDGEGVTSGWTKPSRLRSSMSACLRPGRELFGEAEWRCMKRCSEGGGSRGVLGEEEEEEGEEEGEGIELGMGRAEGSPPDLRLISCDSFSMLSTVGDLRWRLRRDTLSVSTTGMGLRAWEGSEGEWGSRKAVMGSGLAVEGRLLFKVLINTLDCWGSFSGPAEAVPTPPPSTRAWLFWLAICALAAAESKLLAGKEETCWGVFCWLRSWPSGRPRNPPAVPEPWPAPGPGAAGPFFLSLAKGDRFWGT